MCRSLGLGIYSPIQSEYALGYGQNATRTSLTGTGPRGSGFEGFARKRGRFIARILNYLIIIFVTLLFVILTDVMYPSHIREFSKVGRDEGEEFDIVGGGFCGVFTQAYRFL